MQKRFLKGKFMLYRRSANCPTHIIKESPKRGAVYYEFEETWVRPWDGAPSTNRCVCRRFTGKAYKFHDHITPELLEDSKAEREFSKKCLMLTVPTDFTYLRLTRV